MDETRSRLERLRSYSKANHSHGSSGHVHSDRWFVSTATERTTRPGLVLSASGTQFNSRGCQPRANVSTALNHELNAVSVRLETENSEPLGSSERDSPRMN